MFPQQRPFDAANRLRAAKLTKAEIEVLNWRLDGESLEQVALWRRCSRQAVVKIARNAKAKLRRAGIEVPSYPADPTGLSRPVHFGRAWWKRAERFAKKFENDPSVLRPIGIP